MGTPAEWGPRGRTFRPGRLLPGRQDGLHHGGGHPRLQRWVPEHRRRPQKPFMLMSQKGKVELVNKCDGTRNKRRGSLHKGQVRRKGIQCKKIAAAPKCTTIMVLMPLFFFLT